MNMRCFIVRVLCVSVLVVSAVGLSRVAANQRPQAGIVGRAAPSWGVTEWIQLPGKNKTLDIGDLKGKVVYLFCFQSWCPGCHSSGFPTLVALIDRFKDAEDVAFVTVQTVFEGFSANTAKRAWETAREYKLNIPVGHSGTDNRRSTLMQRYRTGGTPWSVIIDKQGVVRFNGFHITPDQARKTIDKLRRESNATDEHVQDKD